MPSAQVAQLSVVPSSTAGASSAEYSDSENSQAWSRENSISASGFFASSTKLTEEEKREAKLKQDAAEEALRKAAVGGGKSITFWGGVAFLINNVTGGGMVLFPQTFQQSGWVVVIGLLLFMGTLIAMCGFMIIEAMAMMPGNKRFEKRVEYTTLCKHYLPNTLYWIAFLFLQLSLLSNSISMIVQSVQVMDFTIAEIFGHSCAVPEFHPTFQFNCPPAVVGDSTVFGSSMYLVPLGWFVTICIVLPLGFVNLDDNIFVQKGGFIAVLTIVAVWFGIFVGRGLDGSRVPPVGNQFTQVIGVIAFNFAIITSIPSWVNEKKENVSIVKSFSVSIPLSILIFTILGLFGGLAFDQFSNNQTVLTAIYSIGSKIAKITFFLFPACVNLTSIPVFGILQRYNLIDAGICGQKMALFLAVICPWLIAIPLYTGSGYNLLVTWSGILITSVVNFVVPPVLYLLAVRETNIARERRASIRMLTGIGGGGHGASKNPLSRPMSINAVNHNGDASGSRPISRSKSAVPDGHHHSLGNSEHTLDVQGDGTTGATNDDPNAVHPLHPDTVVDISAPPPHSRKLRSRRRDREKEKEREKAAKDKAKRKALAERKKKEREMLVPDEPELPQPLLVPVNPWKPPHRGNMFEKALWAILLPVALLFHYSIPHPASFKNRVPESQHGTKLGAFKFVLWATFSIVISTAFLLGLSLLSIWLCTLVAQGTTIHPFMLGLWVLGVATRVPAFITEFKGYRASPVTGDLNRVFLHNVLLMLVCVPVPWLIYTGYHGGANVVLYTGEVTVLGLTLFIMGSMVVIVFRSYDWASSFSVGYPLISLLIFFFVESWLLEYGVVLHLNDDQCITV